MFETCQYLLLFAHKACIPQRIIRIDLKARYTQAPTLDPMEEEARDSSHSPEVSSELHPEPTMAATRTRRSAAAASSRAWAPLLAGKKGLDVSDTEENEKATPVAGKPTETQGEF